jgi:DNA-binding NarL/FixJ family response regulator
MLAFKGFFVSPEIYFTPQATFFRFIRITSLMKILLIDRQFLTAQGVCSLLKDNGHSVCSCPCNKPGDLCTLIRLNQPELLIIDPLSTKGELQEPMLTAINDYSGNLPMLAMTNSSKGNTLCKLLSNGIRCHLSKQASVDEILQGVDAASKQETFYCQRTQDILEKETCPFETCPLEQLSDREKEIVVMIADGKSDREIAENLFLSYHTVRTHRKNISRKLGFSLKNAPALTSLASSLR